MQRWGKPKEIRGFVYLPIFHRARHFVRVGTTYYMWAVLRVFWHDFCMRYTLISTNFSLLDRPPFCYATKSCFLRFLSPCGLFICVGFSFAYTVHVDSLHNVQFLLKHVRILRLCDLALVVQYMWVR